MGFLPRLVTLFGLVLLAHAYVHDPCHQRNLLDEATNKLTV